MVWLAGSWVSQIHIKKPLVAEECGSGGGEGLLYWEESTHKGAGSAIAEGESP